MVPGLQVKTIMATASLVASLMALAPSAAGANGMGLPAASLAMGGTGVTSFYALGFELGPWQEYLAQELTPTYMLPDNFTPVHVSWLRYSDVQILPDFADGLGADSDTNFYMDFDVQSSGQYLAPEADDETSFTRSMFERQYFSPGIEHQLNDTGVLGVAAVIAHQRYSSANLGLLSATTPDTFFWPSSGYRPFEESGYGTGVNLSLRQEIFSGFAIETEYQSRINMEEFAAFRGVYGSAADLDIPARARLGVDFRTSSRSWLNVAMTRVLYSDITAFPSRYLPNRFLSLLGDSTSPSFDWEDLTVYSVGWTWADGAKQEWHFDFSSRSQPTPSSSLLNQALKGELAQHAIVVGYSRRTGPTSHLNFNAAYAPAEYAFGGSVLGVTTDDLNQRFEFEALWTKAF